MIAQEKETTGHCCMEITGKWAEGLRKVQSSRIEVKQQTAEIQVERVGKEIPALSFFMPGVKLSRKRSWMFHVKYSEWKLSHLIFFSNSRRITGRVCS